MPRSNDPTSPLQIVRETTFKLSRPKMAAVLGITYGELYGCETGTRAVSRRIVAGLNALGQDGESVRGAMRQWMSARAAELQAGASTVG